MSIETVASAGRESSFPRAERKSGLLASLAAAALGLMLIYGSGLAQIQALHNAAHDARHAAGFPCH